MAVGMRTLCGAWSNPASSVDGYRAEFGRCKWNGVDVRTVSKIYGNFGRKCKFSLPLCLASLLKSLRPTIRIFLALVGLKNAERVMTICVCV